MEFSYPHSVSIIDNRPEFCRSKTRNVGEIQGQGFFDPLKLILYSDFRDNENLNSYISKELGIMYIYEAHTSYNGDLAVKKSTFIIENDNREEFFFRNSPMRNQKSARKLI